MDRRKTAYWEPIFSPESQGSFEGRRLSEVFDEVTYNSKITLLESSSDVWTNKTIRLKNKEFYRCEITGFFDDRYITFKECTFRLCDFAASHWKAAKFTRCRFISTSLSLTTFEECEFRDCRWENVGISGNETIVRKTIITQPQSLLSRIFVQQDSNVLSKYNSSAVDQFEKNLSSRAELARNIMLSHKEVGKEEDFYSSVRLFAQLNALSKAKKFSIRRAFPWCVWRMEYAVLTMVGAINGWGASILRPFGVGVGLVLIMAVINAMVFSVQFSDALRQTLEIFLIAGYGEHTAQGGAQAAAKLANLAVGIVWYSTVIATFVNRISRVR